METKPVNLTLRERQILAYLTDMGTGMWDHYSEWYVPLPELPGDAPTIKELGDIMRKLLG